MAHDYRARFRDRATYLLAGQGGTHRFPLRDPSKVRDGRLPGWMASPADLDFLSPSNPHFHIDRALFSAGQFLGGSTPAGMFDRRTGATILGDSGGYQLIAKPALWKGDATRAWVLDWLESRTDEAITLDIPTAAIGSGNPLFPDFQSCLQTTLANNMFFHGNRRGEVRFLAALQGRTRQEALAWYDAVKALPFEGWAFGGSTRSYPIMVELLQNMLADGLLGADRARVHILGTSSLSDAVLLSAVQKSIRQHCGLDTFTITFDTSSPSINMLTGVVAGYANISPDTVTKTGNFSISTHRPPSANVQRFPDVRFPIGSSSISQNLTVGDLFAPAVARSNCWDELSRQIVINHNLDSMLRAMDEANNVMELGLADASALAPLHIAQCYWALREAFRYPDPVAHVRKHQPAFRKLGGGYE